MSGIRAFERADAKAVADLYERVFRSGNRVAPNGLVDYFIRIFIDSPLLSDDAKPLVYEDKSGAIIAFIGVQVRPFVIEDDPIRVLISGPMFVDNEAGGSGVGLLLLRALMAYPHDAIVTDGATRDMQKIWNRLVGTTNYAASYDWEISFRRGEYAFQQLIQRPRLARFRPALRMLQPLFRVADKLLHSFYTRNFPDGSATLSAEALTAEGAVEFNNAIGPNPKMRPAYSESSFVWMLDELSKLRAMGAVHKVLLRDRSGKPAAVLVYFIDAKGVTRVLHFAARPEVAADAFHHMVLHADREKSVVMKGRMEPMLAPHVLDYDATFQYGKLYSLIKGTPEVYAVLLSGAGMMTRLDGEWWLGFHREEF